MNNLSQLNNGNKINENDKNVIYKNYINQNLNKIIPNNLTDY